MLAEEPPRGSNAIQSVCLYVCNPQHSGYEPVNMLESHNKLDKNHIN